MKRNGLNIESDNKNEDKTIRYGDNSKEDPITDNDNYIVDKI